jgi:hypothetical protein
MRMQLIAMLLALCIQSQNGFAQINLPEIPRETTPDRERPTRDEREIRIPRSDGATDEHFATAAGIRFTNSAAGVIQFCSENVNVCAPAAVQEQLRRIRDDRAFALQIGVPVFAVGFLGIVASPVVYALTNKEGGSTPFIACLVSGLALMVAGGVVGALLTPGAEHIDSFVASVNQQSSSP